MKTHNVIFERSRFNLRKQEAGEPVDSFITALYTLSEHCNYGALRDEMIRDRIVVGLLDGKLAERFQMDQKLTLVKAINGARHAEAVKKQQSVVRGDDPSPSPNIDAVGRRKGNARPNQKQTKPEQVKKCGRCGKSAHPKNACPARDATCHKCRKKGHYQACCRSKAVESVESDKEESFLGVIEEHNHVFAVDESWNVNLRVNGTPLKFKLDTGADVTVIPENVYFAKMKGTLKDTNKSLIGPNNKKLNVRGVLVAKLEHESNVMSQQVYIVRGLRQPLLGRPAIEKLKLVSRVQEVTSKISKEDIASKYPGIFEGLGKLDGEYTIVLEENAKPYAVTTPRRVAIPLLPKVKEELARMEAQGVISKVDSPTDWCAPMVVVPKTDGKVRLCVDLTKLNESVKKEKYAMASVEHILAQLTGASVFSKIDANSGFYQVNISEESRLTTFITRFGRFCYNRLPFGITSAPEHFQKRMSQLLDDATGSICIVDDVLIYGKDQAEHDKNLHNVLQKIHSAGLTLNEKKCVFSTNQVQFVGQVISGRGVQPDPSKVKAIAEMDPPKNVSEVRRFLGMTNQLGKFSSKLSELSKPIRDLLLEKNAWRWDDPQKSAFEAIKRELCNHDCILAHCDPAAETVVSADASSYGFGAVITQKQPSGEWRPVAYNSRSMSTTEQGYAQVEKEALAATWACERFSDFLTGKSFHIETDHKPLVTLLGKKDLDCLPVRIQRFRMRLMRFHYTIGYVPGKNLVVADALSRSPTGNATEDDRSLEIESELYVREILKSLPASDKRLDQIRSHLEQDEICQQVMTYCREGWPDKSTLKGPIKLYYPLAD